MKSRILLLMACICLIATAAIAHGDEEHVMGTVSAVTPSAITIKTTGSKMVTVSVAAATKFIKNKAAAKVADLSVGDRVVIHAKEISEGNLVADTVEFSSAAAQKPKAQRLTGTVSDAACGATHNMQNMTPAECTRACAMNGKYALVVGKQVYTLQGHESELSKLAAQTATVTGAVNGKAVTVESVMAGGAA